MHSYDTGTSHSARSNNWGLLERVFKKLKIPITHELILKVEKCQLESVYIILSILHQLHLNRKPVLVKFEPNQSNSFLSSSAAHLIDRDDKCREFDLEKSYNHSIHTNTQRLGTETLENRMENRMEFIQKNNPIMVEKETEEESFSGRIASIKLLCSLLGVPEPHGSRYAMLPIVLRESLSFKFNSMESKELECLYSTLKMKSDELISLFNTNGTIEQQILLDIFMNMFIHSSTKSPVFTASVIILCFLGKVIKRTKYHPDGNAYGFLASCKDFQSFLLQIHPESLDRIPFITKIIHSFLNSDSSDSEKIGFLLHVKDCLSKFQGTNASLGFEGGKGHDSCSQYTTLHLSECMTVIHSYKNYSTTKLNQLFYGNTLDDSNPLDSNFTNMCNYEISACIHLLSRLVQCGVSQDQPALSLLIQTTIEFYAPIVCHDKCQLHLQKSFLYFFSSVLNEHSRELDTDVNTDEDSLVYGVSIHKILQIASQLLKSLHNEALVFAILLFSSLLEKYPELSFALTQGILKLCERDKLKLLEPKKTESDYPIDWNLAFVAHSLNMNSNLNHILPWTVASCVCVYTQSLDSCMGNGLLSILNACLKKAFIELKSTDSEQEVETLKLKWATLFESVCASLILSLCGSNTSSRAWYCLYLFRKVVGFHIIQSKLPMLLAAFLHCHKLKLISQDRFIYYLEKWSAQDVFMKDLKELITSQFKNIDFNQQHTLEEEDVNEEGEEVDEEHIIELLAV